MKSQNMLTVEVFRDADSSHLSIDPVIAGIDGLSSIVNNLDITKTNRRLRIAAAHSPTYNVKDVRQWPTLPADLNVVLTDRPFAIRSTAGEAFTNIDMTRTGQRIAVVSAHENGKIEEVTQHEVGHLLGVGHCDNPHCTMHATIEGSRLKHDIGQAQSRFQTQMTDLGIHIDTRSIFRASFESNDPCDSCEKKFAMGAFFLTEAKIGKSVPDSILYPKH